MKEYHNMENRSSCWWI